MSKVYSSNLYSAALDELKAIFENLNEADVDKALELIATARRIVVFGGGREKLQIMGFAMRLYHLGLAVAVEGDMTTPAIGRGDLFIVTVGPGEISTALALLGVAKSAGATILVITAQPSGRAAQLADQTLYLPAQTMANDEGEKRTSILPMGSLYEGALFVLFEVMILRLVDRLKISPEAMRANHTNLE